MTVRMSYLLADPGTVLVAGGSADARDAVRTAILGDERGRDGNGAGTGVTAVETIEAVAGLGETLEPRDDVGCVVALVETPADVETACAAARAGDPSGRLPVVALGDESGSDEAVFVAVARAENCRYLPRDVEDATLRSVVGGCVERFERRRREEAESSLFRTLLAEGELVIFAKDERGRHLYRTDREDSPDPASVVGKTDVDLGTVTLADADERALEDDLQVVETGDPIYREERKYQFTGGNVHWTEQTRLPWRDSDGDIRGVVGYSLDVTRRKRYEDLLAEQADRVDGVIGYVSHDLRTPLQIIHGAVDIARQTDDIEAALEKVEDAADRIEAVVEDTNAISTGYRASPLSSNVLQSLQADALTTDLPSLIEDIWSVVAPDTATLELGLPEGTVVTVDPGTLRPILENLLTNAVDHAGPDVRVRVGATPTNGIYVQDDGPGIPESERDEVTDLGHTTDPDGTGTGLDIVAQTVSRQGWELRIADADAETGARFEIEGPPMVTRTEFEIERADAVELTESGDVGPVSIPGEASYDADADEWTVVGNGSNVWGDTHEFHLVSGRAEPPVRIEGRIPEFEGVESFSKAGFTVRDGRDERDPFGYLGVTETHGVEVLRRSGVDSHTDSEQFEALLDGFPWYRVEYVNGLVTCYLSESRERWIPVDQKAVALDGEVLVGLLVCSHSSDWTAEATFADVRAHELDVGDE